MCVTQQKVFGRANLFHYHPVYEVKNNEPIVCVFDVGSLSLLALLLLRRFGFWSSSAAGADSDRGARGSENVDKDTHIIKSCMLGFYRDSTLHDVAKSI